MKQKLLNNFLLRAVMLVAVLWSAGVSPAVAADEKVSLIDLIDFAKYSSTSTQAISKISDDYTQLASSSYVYANSGAVKFSSSNQPGSLTTVSFTVPANTKFYVSFKAQSYGTDASAIQVQPGTLTTQSFSPTKTSTDGNGDYDSSTLTFENTTSSDASYALTIKATAKKKRFYLDDLEVYYYKSADTPTGTTATTTTIDAISLTNLDLKNGTAAGTLLAAVTVTEGGAAVSGATVTWSSSDDKVATIDKDGKVTLVNTGTVSFTATYAGDETYKGSDATTETYTVVNTTPATTFTKVTDASVLSAGDKLILASADFVMGAKNSSKDYFDVISNSGMGDNLSVTGSEGYNIITLGGSEGAWTLLESLGGKYLSWTSSIGNGLGTADGATATSAQWTISYNSSKSCIEIKNVATNGRQIYYNANRFAAYTSAQTAIQLYRAADTRTATTLTFATTASIDMATSATAALAAAVVKAGETTVEGAVVSYVISPETGLTYEGGTLTATATGEYTITASYAGDETYKAAKATCTVTVTNSSVVTVPTFTPNGGAVAYGTTVTLTAEEGDDIVYTLDGSTPSYEAYILDSKGYAYSTPIAITEDVTIKAIAVKNSEYESEVATATFTIAAPAAPTLDTAAGAVTEGTVVKVQNPSGELAYFYTTDGTAPTYNTELEATGTTTEYADATGIVINEALTLTIIAVDLGGNKSEATTVAYTIKEVPSIDLRGKDKAIEFTPDGFTFSGSGYNDYSDATVKDTEKNEYEGWSMTKVMKQSSGIQLQASNGKIVLPVIKSDAGFTITATMANNTVTISDGTNSESNTLTVTATSANITISATSKYANFTKLTITPTIIPTVTVGEAGYASYVTTQDVSIPTGMTAYIVTAVGDESITLTEVLDAPKGAALIIEAAKGTYTFGDEYAELYDDVVDETPNLLSASDGTITGDGSTIFALGNKDGVGFYLVGNGVTVPAGKAYLTVAAGSVKEFLAFDFGGGVTTGIETIAAGETPAYQVFNLAGQRVSRLRSGIYVVNGKKVLVK